MSSTDVWVSILEFNRQGLALDMASIHKESIKYQSTKSIVVDLLLYKEKIVFFVRRMSGYQSWNFNWHGLALDMNSVIVNGYQSAISIVVDLPFYMNQSVPWIELLDNDGAVSILEFNSHGFAFGMSVELPRSSYPHINK